MRRYIKKKLLQLKHNVNKNPKLKNKVLKVLNHFPKLKSRLKRIGHQKIDYSVFISNRVKPELLIDITHVYTQDLKTGIQRVVRSILNEFQSNPALARFDIQPVFLTDLDGFWCYKYAKQPDVMVVPKKDDIFFGLDLNNAVVAAADAGLMDDWKARDLQISFVVYDILPILHPKWWHKGVGKSHEEWLKAILKCSDSIFCISQTVRNDVERYMLQHVSEMNNQPVLHWFHLGADIDNSLPSKGMPENAVFVLNQLKSAPTFLSVGTVEPRKGYKQALEAFEKIWADDIDCNFVIVGKQGWMVDELAAKMRNHPERNKRLFWLEGISDEYLEKIYAASTCLIAASEGEGFGLPLIEAAQHKLPIIARDIPVFREVAGEHAYYFANENNPSVLADAINDWLYLYAQKIYPKSDAMPWLMWRQSANQIAQILAGAQK